MPIFQAPICSATCPACRRPVRSPRFETLYLEETFVSSCEPLMILIARVATRARSHVGDARDSFFTSARYCARRVGRDRNRSGGSSDASRGGAHVLDLARERLRRIAVHEIGVTFARMSSFAAGDSPPA